MDSKPAANWPAPRGLLLALALMLPCCSADVEPRPDGSTRDLADIKSDSGAVDADRDQRPRPVDRGWREAASPDVLSADALRVDHPHLDTASVDAARADTAKADAPPPDASMPDAPSPPDSPTADAAPFHKIGEEVALQNLYNLYSPTVLTVQGVKRMWVGGWKNADDLPWDRLHLSEYINGAWTVPQPVSFWTYDPVSGALASLSALDECPTFSGTSSCHGTKPGYQVNDPSVIQDPNTANLLMYYTGGYYNDDNGNGTYEDENGEKGGVHMAYSTDGGLNWVDMGVVVKVNDPTWGAWNNGGAMIVGNEIWLYYTASYDITVRRQRFDLLNWDWSNGGFQKIDDPFDRRWVRPPVSQPFDVNICRVGDKLVLVGADGNGIHLWESDFGTTPDAGLLFSDPPASTTPLIAPGDVGGNVVGHGHVEVLSDALYKVYFDWGPANTAFHTIEAWSYAR